jgi:tetratricopeptide (TPR) repeat protein
MKKRLFFPLIALAAICMFSACSGKLTPLSSQYVTAEPQPLEVTGGKVPVTINATFPAKWFNKNAVVTVTPVLRYATGETWGTSYTFQGEKVRANNQTVSYSAGGNATMRTTFDYKPAMKKSELYLTFDAKIKNKVVQLPDIKIADGIIATAALADAATSTPAIGPDKFQRIIKEAYNANIMFLIQQAELRSQELNKGEVSDWKNVVENAEQAPNQNVSVEISAYASPDGGVELNEKLAGKRESNTAGYVEKELKKRNVNVPIDARYTAQDWEGFQELVAKSNLQDKELVLRVLSMYKDPEQREREIKNISTVFKSLADEILPQLRRSRLTANIEIIGKSDEEIKELAKSKPGSLNVEELLYAATLTDNNGEKETIYTKASQLFPNDYRAWNNAGIQRYIAGDYEKAAELFAKSNSIKNNSEANMNLGLLALLNGDTEKAQQLLGNVSDVPVLGEALGLLYLKQGDYAKAVRSFAGSKTNNAAVAQILTKDYSAAAQTLNSVVKPDALTSYLKAIVSARTNDSNGVIKNMREAVEKDRALAVEAANDLEFAKYLQNSAFTDLLK